MAEQATNGDLPFGWDTEREVPFAIDARRLNRHTFWVGQSGSGKTYALGVLLEQVLLRTGLPLLVLDPNSDFVRLSEPRPGVDPEQAAALSRIDVRVLRSGGSETPLRTRFVDLSPAAKAAVLRIDPVVDAVEYSALLRAGRDAADGLFSTPAELTTALRRLDDVGAHALAMRVENLGILDWDLWAWGGDAATDVVEERPAATVLDLGGFRHAGEAQIAALCALEHLWQHKDERRAVLIVLDEAHNLCPATPRTAVEVALTEQVIQIAAEGRKYGLWLLLSTQRPTKIHPNVLTQCDNLALLRVNSPRDLDEIETVFGYAPAELVRRSPQFRQGQALLAGGFARTPTVVQVGDRLTLEGGSDVAVPLTRE